MTLYLMIRSLIRHRSALLAFYRAAMTTIPAATYGRTHTGEKPVSTTRKVSNNDNRNPGNRGCLAPGIAQRVGLH